MSTGSTNGFQRSVILDPVVSGGIHRQPDDKKSTHDSKNDQRSETHTHIVRRHYIYYGSIFEFFRPPCTQVWSNGIYPFDDLIDFRLILYRHNNCVDCIFRKAGIVTCRGIGCIKHRARKAFGIFCRSPYSNIFSADLETCALFYVITECLVVVKIGGNRSLKEQIVRGTGVQQ